MGRDDNQYTRDKNKQASPQAPRREMASQQPDTEWANELGEKYELETRPGFPPTGVRRKD
ncbi:YfhD family protein [Paenibacillus hamazuiensis]|uniref:YfhD family protein n=1 Tax=Paenibacillus hamazuiensis TaxID=2936508 RepID=UPI00200C7114|nr:YfhD family protein [Paenibacillus hamazuiensis]